MRMVLKLLASVEKYTRQELTKVELFNSKEIRSLGEAYYKELGDCKKLHNSLPP